MSRTIILFIVVGILFLIDLYLYRSFSVFFRTSASWLKVLLSILWWSLPVTSILLVAFFGRLPHRVQMYAMNGLGILFFTKLLAFFIMVVGEGWFGLFSLFTEKEHYKEGWLSRRMFIARLGTAAAALPLLTMNYGLFKTAYAFRIHRVKLKFPNLPQAFNGFRIIQISDIHTGSWLRRSAMQDAVDMIHAQKADMIVFTGDLVNNRTDEAFPFIDTLRQLNAPYGVYSILGNHDYGDYETWPDEASKIANMQAMIDLHKTLNWNLLRNESRAIGKDGQQFALIGLENWGGRFTKYGKMDKAYARTENFPFKILLSHDPSHWDAEVIPQYKDVDLMLSGHTHGFQFGVEFMGIRWSPSQWVYKQWAGLYEKGSQYLYVNRGTGCIGYSGRVGIRPEITVIELEAG